MVKFVRIILGMAEYQNDRTYNRATRKSTFDSNGFSIVEAMITVGLIAIISVGVLSIQKMNLDIQRQSYVVNTAQTLRSRIEGLIADQRAWVKTVELNPNMAACLGAGIDLRTACPALIGVPNAFNLYNAAGLVEFTSLAAANSVNGVGFTERGIACGTFNTAGNQCAFAHYISWTAECPAAGTCINPSLIIRAQLFYAPATVGPPLAVTNYSIINPPVRRTATAMNLTFSIISKPNNAAAPFNSGGGVCNTSGAGFGDPRELWIQSDPGQLLTLTGGSTITISQVGTYRCSGTGAAFGTNGFQLSMIKTAPAPVSVLGSGVGYAPENTQGFANFDTTFDVSVPTSFQLTQICDMVQVGLETYSLGMPAGGPGYTNPSIYASMSCTMTNK